MLRNDKTIPTCSKEALFIVKQMLRNSAVRIQDWILIDVCYFKIESNISKVMSGILSQYLFRGTDLWRSLKYSRGVSDSWHKSYSLSHNSYRFRGIFLPQTTFDTSSASTTSSSKRSVVITFSCEPAICINSLTSISSSEPTPTT